MLLIIGYDSKEHEGDFLSPCSCLPPKKTFLINLGKIYIVHDHLSGIFVDSMTTLSEKPHLEQKMYLSRDHNSDQIYAKPE